MHHAALVRLAADQLHGARLRLYATAAEVDVRRGGGWIAVATGVDPNDMNGVISEPGASIDAGVVTDLIAWFAGRNVSATWWLSGDDPTLTATLSDAGARSERSGYFSARALDGDLVDTLGAVTRAQLANHDLDVHRVRNDDELDEWLTVADMCGWCRDDSDRAARRRLYAAVGLDHPEFSHWIARLGGCPVGMASAFWDGETVFELCAVAVIPAARRRGIGTALASVRLGAAHDAGATTVVAELSPDGWKLYARFGFVSIPVRPDRAFYLPLPPATVV